MSDTSPSFIHYAAAALFAVALVHTFSTRLFERLAHRDPRHAGLWHLLGEVEVVFGFWAMVLVALMFLMQGKPTAVGYLESRNFVEPLFVFVVMVIAGTRPILQAARRSVELTASALPLPGALGVYVVILGLVPLLGSFITEPAAMTLAALLLSERIFSAGISTRLMYATLGVLFVNVSIGGTLTSFSAPPVLMVAATWHWDTAFMLANFGWKAALAVALNTAGAAALFRAELGQLRMPTGTQGSAPVPAGLVLVHFGFLAGCVAFAHYPEVFLGIFMLFLGVATAYERHQDRLILREGLLVAFFLAGLVVLGGQQQWWLQPLLMRMDADTVFYGAAALTTVTDNAAVTYLASLVEGLSDEFKYAVVAGAVTGGGLTIIANAPNPAGAAILRPHFSDQTIAPLPLLLGAMVPTFIAVVVFKAL